MIALLEVQDFLKKAGRGEIDSSRFDDLIEQFGEDCKNSLRKQLSSRGGYRIRMSGLGRPLCQQKMEKQDTFKFMEKEILAIKQLLKWCVNQPLLWRYQKA